MIKFSQEFRQNPEKSEVLYLKCCTSVTVRCSQMLYNEFMVPPSPSAVSTLYPAETFSPERWHENFNWPLLMLATLAYFPVSFTVGSDFSSCCCSGNFLYTLN